MTQTDWYIRPNWASSVKTTYEFKTDIFKSRLGNEQRRALRQTPRKTIEFQSTALNENDVAIFHRFLATWQPITLMVPEYPLQVRAVGGVPSGTATFTADRAIPNWMIAGVPVMLRTSSNSFNATLVSADPGTRLVTLDSAPPDGYPVNARLCPLRTCNWADTVKVSRPVSVVMDGTFQFAVAPGSEDAVAPRDAASSFEGTELFLEKPDWSEPLDEELSWAAEIIDAGWGVAPRYYPTPRQVRALRASYWRPGSDSAQALVDFFLRMFGMQGEFLMPTWERDIFPAFDIGAGDDFLREAGTTLADAWTRGWPYLYVMILMRDGTQYFLNVIDSYSVSDGFGLGSILQFDTPFADAIAMADINLVCWVPTWRFASDQITVEWKSDEVGVVAMSFQTVETRADDSISDLADFLNED